MKTFFFPLFSTFDVATVNFEMVCVRMRATFSKNFLFYYGYELGKGAFLRIFTKK